MKYKGETRYSVAQIDGNKAIAVLCSDGRRRTARLYFSNPWTDSQRIAGSVKVNGLTVMGIVHDAKPFQDLHFVAFRDSANGYLLPQTSPEKFKETQPVLHTVIQYMPPYMPSEDNPPTFSNRKHAESYAVEEKARYLEDFYPGEFNVSGSAREGLIYLTRKGEPHDLGWAIEIVETLPCELEPEERNELLPTEPQRYLPGSVLS